MFGTIVVKPTAAKLTYDTEWFARMDPYAKCTIGGTVHQTQVAWNQSKNPVWQDTFNYRVNGEQSMHVAVYDKDTTTRDDYIGECTIPLQQVYSNRQQSGWYNLTRRGGRNAG